MNVKTRVLGIILLMNVWKVSSFQNSYTDGEVMKCGQTPCKREKPFLCNQRNDQMHYVKYNLVNKNQFLEERERPFPGKCCPKDKSCCCVSHPSGFSVNCVSGHSWSMPWWGFVLIVAAAIAVVAAIVILCYRRRKRQTYGQI